MFNDALKIKFLSLKWALLIILLNNVLNKNTVLVLTHIKAVISESEIPTAFASS